jgi:hypothetical protein
MRFDVDFEITSDINREPAYSAASRRGAEHAPLASYTHEWPGERPCATFVEAVADLEAWVLRARAQAQVDADDMQRPLALCH